MKVVLVALFGVLTSSAAFATIEQNWSKTSPKSTPTFGIFSQATDHFGALPNQQFQQRYWVNSTYAGSDPSQAPVLYHMCGEGDCTAGYFLNDNALVWAKALGAHVVYLEHRYYGESNPFADLSNDHLRYLTLDNVLEDLASFQKWIAAKKGWNGKWIALGGSYSGTVAALYRQKHPELVVGALASSAPMMAGVGDAVGTQQDADDLESEANQPSSMGRPWTYQACTTFGFWEATGPNAGDEVQFPSQWLCSQVFGTVPYVNSAAYNQAHEFPFLANSPQAPSNILFTYGSDDVWTAIGLDQRQNQNHGILIQIIDGAGHHFDLNPPSRSDSAAVLRARAQFATLAKQWLGLP